jgi:hypothetical protein
MRALMAIRSHAATAFLMVALLLTSGEVASLAAHEPPLELKWDQLVPPAPPKLPKPFFAGRPADLGGGAGFNDGTPPPPPQPEGRWMSGGATASALPTPVVAALNGKRVHIGGYVVPLDFDATRVKEFLLVPYVGACIHVPPPPANQIIYVKAEQGFDVRGSFDPVWVTGALKVMPVFTGLAETGYSLEAERVDQRPTG